MNDMDARGYLEQLRDKRRARRVTRDYQLAGLTVAELLGDEGNKSLYIKLAKQYGNDRLVALAKDVAERRNVRNKGAYFMKVIHETVHHGQRTGKKVSRKTGKAG